MKGGMRRRDRQSQREGDREGKRERELADRLLPVVVETG